MLNYGYENRTRLIFGRDTEKQIGELVKPYAEKVLLVYGGGSIKRNGLYDTVAASLKEAGIQWVELAGIKPNPRLDKVHEGVKLCKENKIGFILAVGGGSVIDTAKSIAAGALYDGDAWDFYTGNEITDALPVATILTIPASGSESSVNAVITNEETQQKFGIGSELLRPVFSILNPAFCMSLSREQLAPGVFDIMSHTLERYFTPNDHTDLTDELCEGLLRATMRNGLKLMRDTGDYDAWAEIMQAGNLSHNGQMGMGRAQDWANHPMEHELSALYDVPHGAGLAVTTIAWMKYVYKKHLPMFVQFAVNVMGVKGALRQQEEIAWEGILALEDFCKKMNLPTRMSELGIDDKNFELMAKKCVGDGTLGGLESLNAQDIVAIYKLASEA